MARRSSDFHPVALATPLLLFAWWHLDEERLWAFALLAGAAMATKEHVGLAVALMGVWYAVRHRRQTRGARDRGRCRRRGSRRRLPRRASLRRRGRRRRSPAATTAPSLDGRDLRYLSELLFPLLFLPLAAPLAALAARPELGLNLLSSTVTQTSDQEPLRRGGHPGAARGDRLRQRRGSAEARLPGARRVRSPGCSCSGRSAGSASGRRDTTPRRGARSSSSRGRPVSATNRLGAHLSARERIFSFPVLREADWVVVDERRLTFLDSLKPGRARPPSAALRRDPRWRLVFAEDGVLVFRRVPG